VRGFVAGLEAEPIYASEAYRVLLAVEKLVALDVQKAGQALAVWSAVDPA
jgi:hypothetical protein